MVLVNVKSNVRPQVMNIKKDRPIVQDSKSLAEVAQKFVSSTEIKHFYDEEIANYEKINPFRNSISANRIFDMHVSDGSNTTMEKFCIPQDRSKNRHKHRQE